MSLTLPYQPPAPAQSGAFAFTVAKHPLLQDKSAVERFRLITLFIMMMGGGFVMAEPSPYEVGAMLALLTFFLSGGLAMHRLLWPLLIVMMAYVGGLTFAATQVADKPKVIIWVAVSWYLAITAWFFAVLMLHNAQKRMDILIKGWTIGAVIAAFTGVAGYFRLIPLADLFVMYGRAKGTFNDPNLLGPFIIFPALICIQILIKGATPGKTLVNYGTLGLLTSAILLSFSRAAWAHFVISTALMLVLMFITFPTNVQRIKLIILVFIGAVIMALLIVGMLQLPQVARLMSERASLSQTYDMGPMGRFGRHDLGWLMAYDRPFGYGPLQFSNYFPEDAHNVYLNSFFGGGYVAGLAYFIMVALSTVVGFWACFKRAPWQNVAIALFATWVGLIIEGRIIDTEHWRHFYPLMGLMWSLAIASTKIRAVPLVKT